ncbi:Cyclic AMP-dependent transcription factor ATF-4 [Toxocara canis]|uniref:Cyclic AMP-dependent transcription factor ATF-4 n=1 Tax=Toxocara canis TaxID=6265 RepID=A0A0B2VTV6_TOXCA|nr:Cyclic AMP-dependent transcription factor ATF-4 [Toxocara canis]
MKNAAMLTGQNVHDKKQRPSSGTTITNRYSKSAHESYSSISELEHNVRERSPEQIFEEIDISFDQPALVPQREHSEKKKAQNRAAATRYRERKRREREVARLQVLQLETYNAKLRARATEIEKEISYLRNLMEEVHSRSR